MIECWVNGSLWRTYSITELVEVLDESFGITFNVRPTSVKVAALMNSRYCNTNTTTVYYLPIS